MFFTNYDELNLLSDMKKNVVFSTLLLGLIYFSAQCLSQTVITHPVPEEFRSKQYSVEINGIAVQVFQASPRVHFASFDFTGKANVKVNGKIFRELGVPLPIREEQLDGSPVWEGEAIVRPLSRNIKVDTNGSIANFTLDKPGQYAVEGTKKSQFATDNQDMVLFLFANKPESDQPKEGDSKVIYLKAGTHQQNIDLKSGETLYLEAGAVLFGSIDIWDAHDVKILGRGVVFYYGPQSENHDDGYLHKKKWHPLTTENSEVLTISGITFVGRSRTWTIQMHTTYDANFDNVKVLGVNDQNVNGDGFDWQGGGRTRITNSLVRSADDCFAFFSPRDSEDRTVKDIRIENCVIWPTRANIYKANGWMDNVVMINSDIIHVPFSLFEVPRALICSAVGNNQNNAILSNFLFENVRFEEPAALLGISFVGAQFSNIVFRNISMNGEPLPSYVNANIDGIIFDNVILNGKQILGEKDLEFKLKTNEIKNLKFVQATKN